MSKEEWMLIFGCIYGELVDVGLLGVMVGYIYLLNVEKEMYLEWDFDDMLLVLLNKIFLDELLRGELGYNGVIVMDVFYMVGMIVLMLRRDLLLMVIEVGCDLFLFFNDFDEDI